MKTHEYAGYEDYVAAQTAANKAKIDEIWVSQGNIRMIRAHFGPLARTVLCHGTRNAAEQKLFKVAYQDSTVVGTEISDTANQFPMTIQHDMQEPIVEWFDKFDVVYSNAFDHCINPLGCLETWIGQLSEGGRLYVDYADDPKVNCASESDPLALEGGDMQRLVALASGELVTTLDGKSRKGHRTTIYVIRRKNDLV